MAIPHFVAGPLAAADLNALVIAANTPDVGFFAIGEQPTTRLNALRAAVPGAAAAVPAFVGADNYEAATVKLNLLVDVVNALPQSGGGGGGVPPGLLEDVTELQTAVALKANAQAVADALALKANATSLAAKLDQTQVDARIAAAPTDDLTFEDLTQQALVTLLGSAGGATTEQLATKQDKLPAGTGLVALTSTAGVTATVTPVQAAAASSVPTLANMRFVLTDGTYLTGLQVQTAFGVTGTPTPTPTPSPSPTPTPTPTGLGNGARAMVLNGSGLGHASTPRLAAYNPQYILDARVKVNAASWTAGAALGRLFDCWDGSVGFIFSLNSDGTLGWVSLTDTFNNVKSTAALSVPTNSDVWLRMAIEGTPTNSSYAIMRPYTSVDNEASWQQLGIDNIIYNGVMNYSTTEPLRVGNMVADQGPGPGVKFKAARLLTDAGEVFSADFSTLAANATSFTAATGQVVTINSPAVIA